ncbi:MAG TPA: LAETG motif-containing sortase-dependent surface protein [Streptomyces sp.]
MSRTQYSSRRSRSLALLAATAFAASAAPLLAAAPASATSGCSSATIQYRLDGGDWTSSGGFRTFGSGLDKVEVRLAPGQEIGAECKYPVSLAKYTTEGPSWYNSGKQTLVEKKSVYLGKDDVAGKDDAGRTWQKLSVETPDCYGQIDLYGDDVTYDGGTGEGHGPAPYQPDNIVTPKNLIAAWNGGEKACEEGGVTPPPSTPTTPEAPTTPPASETTPPPAGETTPPPATPTTPVSETTPPTTPEVPPMEGTPPATTPTPSPSESTPPLAETGSSTPVGPIAGGAAAVVAIGAGAMFFANRSRKKGSAQ